jgi:hypothetical protein
MLWRDGPIEIDHRRRHDRAQRVVERRYPRPVRVRESARAAWQAAIAACSAYGPFDAAQGFGALQGGESPRRIRSWSQRARFCSVRSTGAPSGAVRAGRRDAWISISASRPKTSGSSDATPARMRPRRWRLGAQRRADQVLAGGGGIALVEDQVDDLQHRGEPLLPLLAARQLEAQAGLAERALGADDALGDGRFAGEEGARDLVGGEPADQASVSAARASADNTGWQAMKMRLRSSSPTSSSMAASMSSTPVSRYASEVAADLIVLAREHAVAAGGVDGAALGRGHQPGTGVVRDARISAIRTTRSRRRSCASSSAKPTSAHHPGQARDEPGPFDPEDRLDRLMRFSRRHLLPLKGSAGATQAVAASGRASAAGRLFAIAVVQLGDLRGHGVAEVGDVDDRRISISLGPASDWGSASPTRPPRPGP